MHIHLEQSLGRGGVVQIFEDIIITDRLTSRRPGKVLAFIKINQFSRIFTFSFTSMDSTSSLHTNNSIIFFLVVKSSLVKLEASHTVILPPTASVLWCVLFKTPHFLCPRTGLYFSVLENGLLLPNVRSLRFMNDLDIACCGKSPPTEIVIVGAAVSRKKLEQLGK